MIMTAVTSTIRPWLIAIVLLLAAIVFLLATRPAAAPAMPRIVDEHGNNLVYQCPSPDPRCSPTPVSRVTSTP